MEILCRKKKSVQQIKVLVIPYWIIPSSPPFPKAHSKSNY